MSGDAYLERCLSVKGANNLGQRPDNVVECMHFVVVQYNTPHFFFILLLLSFGFRLVNYLHTFFRGPCLLSVRGRHE